MRVITGRLDDLEDRMDTLEGHAKAVVAMQYQIKEMASTIKISQEKAAEGFKALRTKAGEVKRDSRRAYCPRGPLPPRYSRRC